VKVYDEKVPHELKKTQNWFGSIISRAIDAQNLMDPISPSGVPMEVEACEYIRPSPTLKPAQRIQIYNQQYWWRLLNAMQETFPLVTRLFGYHDFNYTIAIPYLLQYPPNHWGLHTLGDQLPQWVQDSYTAKDKRLIYNASLVDTAFCQSFIAPHQKALDAAHIVEGNLSTLLDVNLFLQPHIHLFQFPYDLLTFRIAFMKESPDYWLEHDFPPFAKDRTYQFILFRSLSNDVCWSDITPAEFGLLQQFQKGSSINQACEWLEGQEETLVEEASQNLHRWFKEWAVRQWLTTE
jgi:hypothetical protein